MNPEFACAKAEFTELIELTNVGSAAFDKVRSDTSPSKVAIPLTLLRTNPPTFNDPGPKNNECQRYSVLPRFHVRSRFGVIAPPTEILPVTTPPTFASNELFALMKAAFAWLYDAFALMNAEFA